MILLLLLCLKLCVLRLSATELEITCKISEVSEPDIIYLIKDVPVVSHFEGYKQSNQIQAKLNEKIIKKCGEIYIIKILHSRTRSYYDFIKIYRNKKNIINLFVLDYYNNHKRYDNLQRNPVYAGDVYDVKRFNQNIPLHLENQNPVYKTNCTESANTSIFCTNWINSNETYDIPAVKIMTNHRSEIHSGDLFDFVTKMHFYGEEVHTRESCLGVSDKTSHFNIVLICSDNWSPCFRCMPYAATLKFRSVSTNECMEKIQFYKNKLLAILSPTPFDVDDTIKTPTLFYKTTDINPEIKDQFPNSMSLVSLENLLKYGFMKFIKDMKWRRVAIISDDSPRSLVFQKEMEDFFISERIVYNIQDCKRNLCNFKEAMKNLAVMDARILIANADEVNAQIIHKEYETYYFRQFTMIYRVWPFWNSWTHKKSIAITMGPDARPYQQYFGRVPKSPNCLAMLHGLNAVVNTYDSMSNIENIKKNKFFSLFADAMKQALVTKPVVYISDHQNEIFTTIEMSDTGGITSGAVRIPFERIPEDERWCLTKTNKFEKPCDVTIILLLMFVVTLFMLFVLIIFCYFHETSPIHDGSYTQM